MQLFLYSLLALFFITSTVIVHEYGHLRACRKHGVAVDEFSIGFGKTLKTWTTKKGLKVNWKLIPAGGSVSPSGMTVEEVKEKDLARETSYIYSSPLVRLRVTLAGIGYNMLFALLLELIIVPVLLQPSTWQEWLGLPGTIFWATLAILGSFISIVLTAPLNGFSHVNSVIKMPEGLESTVHSADDQNIPVILIILMAWMSINMFMAIMNSLPVYPLDGFFIATAVADWSRKHIHGEAYEPLTYTHLKYWVIAGYSAMMLVMTFIVGRDILQLI